jgi:hypothetical protein
MDLLAEKVFGPQGKDDEAEEEAKAEVGTSAEQEESPADNTHNAEGLDIVEGDVTGEDEQVQASILRHVMDQEDNDKSTTDKTGEKDVKEQVLPDDWDVDMKEENEQKVPQMEEDRL